MKHRQESHARHIYRPKEATDIALNDVEKVLVDLGNSFIEEGLVGLTVSSTTPASRPSVEVGSRNDGNNYAHARFSGTDPTLPYRPSPHSSRSQFSENISRDRDSIQTQPARSDRLYTTRLAPGPLSSRTSTTSLSTNSTTSTRGPSASIEVQHRDESDYMAVQPSENIIHLVQNLNSETLRGYINSNQNSTIATLNRAFPLNIISERFAASLGLDIQYHHDEDGASETDGDHVDDREDVIIDFGAGYTQLIIGTVAFNWNTSQEAPPKKPLKVVCKVCKHVRSQTPLVFGQLFLQRREFYWSE